MAPRKTSRSPGKASAADTSIIRGARKLIEFDPQTLQAMELLSRDREKSLQALADEAFRDLLKKHGRPASLKEALRQSTRQIPANDRTTSARKKSR
jgi:hypothetical protein